MHPELIGSDEKTWLYVIVAGVVMHTPLRSYSAFSPIHCYVCTCLAAVQVTFDFDVSVTDLVLVQMGRAECMVGFVKRTSGVTVGPGN